METDDESPLLNAFGPKDVYDRFTPAHKRTIVRVAGVAAFVTTLVTGTFNPSIEQIARDLKAEGYQVNWSVSIAQICAAISGMLFAVYSSCNVVANGGTYPGPRVNIGIGFLVEYVRGWPGLVLNLVCLFLNGVGIDVVLSPSSAYFVDIIHSRSAEVMAATTALRSFIAVVTAGILPAINKVGVAPVNTFTALLAWVGFALLWITIEYGDKMRDWVDIGYSTPQDN